MTKILLLSQEHRIKNNHTIDSPKKWRRRIVFSATKHSETFGTPRTMSWAKLLVLYGLAECTFFYHFQYFYIVRCGMVFFFSSSSIRHCIHVSRMCVRMMNAKINSLGDTYQTIPKTENFVFVYDERDTLKERRPRRRRRRRHWHEANETDFEWQIKVPIVKINLIHAHTSDASNASALN